MSEIVFSATRQKQIMAPTLDSLEQPIGLRPDLVAATARRIRVKQHAGLGPSDFTVTGTNDSEPESSPTKLFSVDGHVMSWQSRRNFRDGSGLPLFEVARKKAGVTWFVHLPKDDGEPIATITTRFHALKDKFDVYFNNAAGSREKVQLEVRGQDIWKLRTNVYFGERMVMTCKRTDKMSVYIPGKALEWDVDIVQGMDMSIASLIVVVMAQQMYQSSYPSSESSRQEARKENATNEKDDDSSIRKA
ncbi:hypothetical protein PISL3812_01471 [Talaromyces islandicus]|uniref:Tubby C-terminal-like domain-containing protein n=1 Tax=Talaromyces islandicus TaxID=28573 RepID=A0A0U1LM75_TALIS|nr:hypothetical protein PISL3812_01471 [Talaromyces islandicus]